MKHNNRCLACGRFVGMSATSCWNCGGVVNTIEPKPVKNSNAGIPLVFFKYLNKKTGEVRQRKVRVVRADGNVVQGFEVQHSWQPMGEGQFKTFLMKNLQSSIILAEFLQ